MKSVEEHTLVRNKANNILGVPLYKGASVIGRSKEPTDEVLIELRSYAEQFLTETDRGLVKTMTLILSPYKDNIIIKDLREELLKYKETL